MSAVATPAGAAPGLVTGWHSIDWRKVWRNVRRPQARIVKGEMVSFCHFICLGWFLGRPRGRSANSKPKRLAVRRTQAVSPNG